MDKKTPFITLWNDIKGTHSRTDNQVFYLKTLKLDICFGELFDCMRNNQSNYIYIKGLNPSGKEVTGLLCIDEEYNFATIETCFFIGSLGNTYDITCSALDLFHYLGEYGRYMVCKPILTEKEFVSEKTMESFFNAIEDLL